MMIKFAYGVELSSNPGLRHEMFADRASQFSKRLRWDVSVDDSGEERDEYDALNPLYIIVVDGHGQHQGSMRLLPTVGRTMVNEHFVHLTDGVEIRSPFIWECTRFCISRRASRQTAPLLMAAGAKIMQECALDHYVAVFDARMQRIYARLGSSPDIQSTSGSGPSQISVGLWDFDDVKYRRLLQLACVSAEEMDLFYVNSPISGGFLSSMPQRLSA